MSVAIANHPGNDPAPRVRRWTVDDYHRAADLGFFKPDERLELIDGEVIEKVSPQRRPHTVSVYETGHALETAFGAGFYVETQSPMTISDRSEPEPDILVVPGAVNDHPDRHPGPSEVCLLVEVSDSTLAYDRGAKAALYASAGVIEYWIVNIAGRAVEIHRDPSPEGRYRTLLTYVETDTITPLAASGSSVRVADLLPAAV